MNLILEIRAAEGGDHAKRLVKRQADIYKTHAQVRGLACSVVQDSL